MSRTSSLHQINIQQIDIHLSPGYTENVLCVSHLSCALSEERESLETEVVGCGRPCL